MFVARGAWGIIAGCNAGMKCEGKLQRKLECDAEFHASGCPGVEPGGH
jgi:hypothetical protein